MPANTTAVALAAWRRFHDEGPAFWADFGSVGTIVGQLLGGDCRHTPRASPGGAPEADSAAPWATGSVGWFGYEAGAGFERMPAPIGPRLLPDAWWGTIGEVVIFDGAGRPTFARGRPIPESDALPPSEPRSVLTIQEPDDDGFLSGVHAILGHLRRGDVYQVNLSRRVVVRGRLDPLRTWLRLLGGNRARRAVFIDTGAGAVVSNSPELLLRARGRRVLSVPIKGTASGADSRRALLTSRKEKAELTMIVDLVRSDLGRVAEPGTVLTGPRRVGRIGHLWHAMRRVEATLAQGKDPWDAFSALFPPGSVTGAPRVAAMEIIRALEPCPRGVYCGTVGWFGERAADLNVAIRTISFLGDEAHVQTGSGIVLGSDPVRELAEARLKAERLLAAL
ncbi:MAG: anthranilate synthase component I family protein [Myxococcales bacterium]|nr:anthranilate synthase component I family protein [Myxococcales bacterium]